MNLIVVVFLSWGLLLSLSVRANEVVSGVLVSDFSPEYTDASAIEMDILAQIETSAVQKINFTRRHVSLTKALALLTSIDDACVLNVVKTPSRQKIAIYTEYPLMVSPPIRLITLAESDVQLDDPFDLNLLVNKPSLTIGIVDSRQYGQGIDEFVAAHQKMFYRRPYTYSAQRFIKMMKNKRLDGILEFSRSIEEHFALNALTPLKLKVYSVVQAGDVLPGYIACAKSPEGQQLVNAINRVYDSLAFRQQVIQAHSDYYGQSEMVLLGPILTKMYKLK